MHYSNNANQKADSSDQISIYEYTKLCITVTMQIKKKIQVIRSVYMSVPSCALQ